MLDNRANGYCYTYSASRGDTPTPTITCPSAAANSTATPTPQVNNVWFQMWVQTLVPGVNQLRLSPDKLGEDAPASISRPAKRSIQMESSMADSSRNSTSAPVSKPRPVHLGLENYKPLPQYCIHPKYKIIAPRWDDKEDLVNIRYATPVNATLMKMMGFNMKIYMDTIIFDQMVVDYYNNKDGFTSPAALKYQIRNSTN